MTAPSVCLECGAQLTPADAGGLCPKCLLKLGFASQLASGTLPATAAGLTPDGTFTEPFDFGGYRILRLLGKGGMGAVYEAEHLSSGRRVALKVLGQTLDSPEMRQRFLREGQLAAAVRHPNVVAVFGTEEVEGAPVIAMELVPDGTLKDQVKRRGPLPIAEAVDATLEIIDGLEAAHAGGVLHRDVKPTNCFVAPGGVVKVGDFGLSISTLVKAEAQLTQPGTVLGTPAFASPEQLRAQEIDVRSDIYSVGATLYHLLTGKPPHDAETLVALIAAALERRPVEPQQCRAEVPRSLSQIVMHCLAKDAGARFQSYAALRGALLPFSSASPAPAPLTTRFVAGLIDAGVGFLPPTVISLCLTGFDLESTLLIERSAAAFLAFVLLVAWEIACVGIPEGLWGMGLGKALCGLRVVRTTGAPPGMARALWRSVIFCIVPRVGLLALWLSWGAEEYRRASLLGDSVPQDWIELSGFFALFVTMRRRNGFAAIQDLLSHTRVVVAAARPARLALPVPTAKIPLKTGERIGPFAITTRRGDLALGFDEVLRRHVWIRLLPSGAHPVRPERRDLNRPARLRWLNGRRSLEENWDAFEAPHGMPLTAYLDGQQPWERVRGWLLDLAEEFHLALDDRTLPETIGLDRVWLTRDSRAVLLEFPAPGADVRPTRKIVDQKDAQGFLDQIASASLAPRTPMHARGVLHSLRTRGYESVALAGGNLKAAMDKPATISPRRRLLSFTIAPAIAIIMGLIVTYAIAWDMRRFESMWQKEYPGRTSFRQVLETFYQNLGDYSTISPAFKIIVAGRYLDVLHDESFWERLETDAVTNRTQREFVENMVATVADTDLTPEKLRAAEQVFAPYLLALQNHERYVISQTFPLWVLSVLSACGLVAFVSALLFATPPGLRLHDIAVITANGSPARRWRVALRTLAGWSPVFIATIALFGVRLSDAPEFCWMVFAGCVLLVVIGAVLAVRRPERALHDYLTGTFLVTR